MDFGMPFLMELDTVEHCAAFCKELGLQFLELNLNFPQCSLENPEALKRAAQENGIYLTIHLDETQDVCHTNPLVRRAYLDTALKAIEAAKYLHCPIINMHLSRGIYITLPGERVFLYEKYEEDYRKNLLEFRKACEAAIGDSGLRIAVENTEGFLEHERRGISLLLESPVFGLTLDTGHEQVACFGDADFYEENRSRLIHMHAHDAKDGHPHLAFGDGVLDLRGKLALAKEAGTRVVVETKTVAALKASVEKLGQYAEVF